MKQVNGESLLLWQVCTYWSASPERRSVSSQSLYRWRSLVKRKTFCTADCHNSTVSCHVLGKFNKGQRQVSLSVVSDLQCMCCARVVTHLSQRRPQLAPLSRANTAAFRKPAAADALDLSGTISGSWAKAFLSFNLLTDPWTIYS